MSTLTPTILSEFISPNLFSRLCKEFPDLQELCDHYTYAETQLQELSHSGRSDPLFQNYLKLVGMHLKIISAQFVSYTQQCLQKYMDQITPKPELARRAAATILTLNGLLPTNPNHRRLWQQRPLPPSESNRAARVSKRPTNAIPTTDSSITNTHTPTYNKNSGADAGGGVGSSKLPPTASNSPQPPKPTNSKPKTLITNIHVPTYNDFPPHSSNTPIRVHPCPSVVNISPELPEFTMGRQNSELKTSITNTRIPTYSNFLAKKPPPSP